MAGNTEKQGKNIALPKGIRQKENGTYCIDFRQNGKRHTKTVKTLEEALQVLAEIKEFNGLVAKKDITVGHAIAHCYKTQWINFKNVTQLLIVTRMIAHYFGNKTFLSKINQSDVAGFIDFLKKRDIKDSSINLYLSKLGTIFNRCYDDELIQRKIKIRQLKIRSKERNILSKKQEIELIDYFRNTEKYDDYADLTCLLLKTGLRVSEALKLKKEHIDVNQKIIYVYVNKTDTPRGIPFGEEVMEILQKRMQYSELFPLLNYPIYRMHFNKAKEKLKLPKDITIHSLRHTCITRLAQKGANISIIMAWAGHKNMATSQKYTHLGLSDVKEFAISKGII